jgi:hypothetical protein
MKGSLPADLHAYFHINTDVGAWAYGRAVALRLVEAQPDRSVLILRALIPRTFIDCNRPATQGTSVVDGAVTPKLALSAGILPYVRDSDDLALLQHLHGQYVDVAAAAFAAVCGQGGLALVPHTYGPRSLGIPAVDDDIVKNLRLHRALLILLSKAKVVFDASPQPDNRIVLQPLPTGGSGSSAGSGSVKPPGDMTAARGLKRPPSRG